MNATLRILFDDGTSKEIPLGDKCIEINLPPTAKQSIAINQTPKGGFNLSYTKALMDGKKWEEIVIRKDEL